MNDVQIWTAIVLGFLGLCAIADAIGKAGARK